MTRKLEKIRKISQVCLVLIQGLLVFLEVPKYPHFGCFWPLLPTRLNFLGVFYAGTVGQNEFFYKIRWSEKSILAR